jgi:hypothetical protein
MTDTPSKLILEELGIDLTTLKSIRPRSKRAQYQAIVSWLAVLLGQNVLKTYKMTSFCQVLEHLTELTELEHFVLPKKHNFTKLRQLILAELDIYPTEEVKTIKNKRIRAHHRAVINWITTYYKPGLYSLRTGAIYNLCKEILYHLAILDRLEKYDESSYHS